MERLNNLIREYVIDRYEQYKEIIDDMAIDDNSTPNDMLETLKDWLFNGIALDKEDDILVFTDWLKINHYEYYDTFLTATNGFEMLEIIGYIEKCGLDYDISDSFVSRILGCDTGYITDKIFLQYTYFYGTTELLEEGYTDILNMVEGRDATIIMPK